VNVVVVVSREYRPEVRKMIKFVIKYLTDMEMLI
tara:strand:+ start:678 stop:779 length:102 start_codon:yes stop_codon:yes gene_type:complete